jgi:hypothetical protein
VTENSTRVAIDLSGAEALVLFDWLVRFNDRQDNEFEDQAERRVLCDIEAILEKELVEPFRSDYLELLQRAREQVRDPGD